MASPQTGIFALGTAAHAYLEFDLLASANGPAAVASVARMREPRTTIGGVARAVTGAYYVIPPADRLAAFGEEDRA